MMLRRYGHAIERLGKRYRLDDLLGSGGMADVCRAWDEQEGRYVAVKVINADELEIKDLNRFMAEAVRTIWLNHPNIINVYGFSAETLDGDSHLVVPYIVMEYAAGGALSTRLKRLRPGSFYPFDEAVGVFYQLCAAVDYAHQRGIIHRDLKPHNTLFRILPDGSEQAILSDFGIAVEAQASHRSLTRSGTLAYMAPEQFRGEPIFASDIFALGVILYQLMTNRLPFERSWHDFARTSPQAQPPLPSTLNPGVAPALDAVILRALANDPARRFARASLFAEAIRDALPAPAVAPDLTRPIITDILPPRVPTRVLPPPTDMPSPSVLPHITGPAPMPNVFTETNTEYVQPLLAASRSLVTDVTEPKSPALSPLTSAPVDRPIKLVKRGKPTAKFPVSVASIPTPVASAMPLPKPAKVARTANKPTRPSRLLIAGLLLILLTLMLIVLGVTYIPAQLPLVHFAGGDIFPIIGSSDTVNIVPDSQTVSGDSVVAGVTGPAAPGQSQISIRQLSYTTPAQTAKVTGTGNGIVPAKVATGILQFENGSVTPFTFGTTTPFTASNGIAFYLDAPVTIPGANLQTGLVGKATGTAHAGTAGAAGNIAAGAINITNTTTFITNPAPFVGGVDAQHYTFIQQSDVNSAVSGIQGAVNASAQKGLTVQLQPGEALVSQVACGNPVVSMNAPVGDKGPTGSAASGTASVTETCTGQAYKQPELNALATVLLNQTAQKQVGAGYALVGNVVTSVTTVSTSPVELQVAAKGVYAYQFSQAQKAALANLIKGMSAAQAIATLEGQTGVRLASIPSDVATLPSNANQITINVLMPPGLSGGGTPTPTVTTPNAGTPSPTGAKG